MEAELGARLVVLVGDAAQHGVLPGLLRARGYAVHAAADLEQALSLLDEGTDVVITDDTLSVSQDVVRRGRVVAPHAVFMGAAEASHAVELLRAGADYHLARPLDIEALVLLLETAAQRAHQHRELSRLQTRSSAYRGPRRVLGKHASVQKLLAVVKQVAPSRASVLITGETGTGKELIARTLHECSGRSGQFVAVSCAALAESLLESELFGHERGAFTGAMQRRDGRFKQADGGTLFLDEVSEIPAGTQLKLLRFLQEREYERVGSNRTERVDVRVVAASNRNLEQLVRDGQFRRDLFYRLNVVELSVPPLRARLSDLPALADFCIRQACVENDRELVPVLSAEALDRLLAHSWPGNVRELRNAMERATVLCSDDEIDVHHLPALTGDTTTGASSETGVVLPGMTMADLEKLAILRTLEAVDWSPARAASMLGISTRTVQYRLKQWGIDRVEHSRRGVSLTEPPLAGPRASSALDN